MIRKTVVIPCNLPMDWPADYIRQTAHVLSDVYTVICYRGVEPYYPKDILRSVVGRSFSPFENYGGVIYYRPVFLFPGNRHIFVRQINHFINILFLRLLGHISPSDTILWYFDPLLRNIRSFFGKDAFTYYDCVDLQWDPDPEATKLLRRAEERFISECNFMTVNSYALQKFHWGKRQNIPVVPQGFRLNAFRNSKFPTARRHHPPVVGFVGVLNYRLDYPLLIRLAKENPDLQFVYYGRIDTTHDSLYGISKGVQELFSRPNVFHDIIADQSKIQAAIDTMDVCVIPYRDIPCNTYCFPMKVMEYWFCGKPTVSSDIIELRRYADIVSVARTTKQWTAQIRRHIQTSPSPALRNFMRRTARSHAWKEKISVIQRLLLAVS